MTVGQESPTELREHSQPVAWATHIVSNTHTTQTHTSNTHTHPLGALLRVSNAALLLVQREQQVVSGVLILLGLGQQLLLLVQLALLLLRHQGTKRANVMEQ